MILQRLTPFYTWLDAPVASEPMIKKDNFHNLILPLTKKIVLIALSWFSNAIAEY